MIEEKEAGKDSGSAYRGSNPCVPANPTLFGSALSEGLRYDPGRCFRPGTRLVVRFARMPAKQDRSASRASAGLDITGQVSQHEGAFGCDPEVP